MKRSLLYKVISYTIIVLVFLSMAFYLEASILASLIFALILSAILHLISVLLNRGVADKNALLAVKILMYITIVMFVFMFTICCNQEVDLYKRIISTIIGSGSVIGYLIAISHTGRIRNEL